MVRRRAHAKAAEPRAPLACDADHEARGEIRNNALGQGSPRGRTANDVSPPDPGKMDDHLAGSGIGEHEPWVAFIADPVVRLDGNPGSSQHVHRVTKTCELLPRPISPTGTPIGQMHDVAHLKVLTVPHPGEVASFTRVMRYWPCRRLVSCDWLVVLPCSVKAAKILPSKPLKICVPTRCITPYGHRFLQRLWCIGISPESRAREAPPFALQGLSHGVLSGPAKILLSLAETRLLERLDPWRRAR